MPYQHLASLHTCGIDTVYHCARRFMPEQVAVANTTASATAVYNMALQLPHTATRVKVLENAHIAINGMFKANVLSRSTLLHAFSSIDLTPYLLKVPRKPADAQVEFSAWEALALIPHLAGPLRLISLEVRCCLALLLHNVQVVLC